MPSEHHYHAEEKQYPSASAFLSQYSRQLRRPAFRRVSSSAIKAVAPELGNVAIDFILQKIAEAGEGCVSSSDIFLHAFTNISSRMYYTARKSNPRCPPSRLPRDIQISLPSSSSSPSAPCPTHVLAVYSSPSALAKQRVSLYSVHALILAATCSNLPPLAYSKASVHSGTATVPVVPLCISSPEMFGVLLEYLYTFDTDTLIRSLLPVSNSGGPLPPPEVMAKHLKANPMAIQGCLSRIYGLYNDICALGVFDEKLWRAMEASWEVCWTALGV